MSEQHTPDPEFVEYLQNEVKSPYLSAMSVMQMERAFIDQRNKYEAKLAAHRMAEEVWEKTMMEVIGEDGPASVADAIRKLQDQVTKSISKPDCSQGGAPCPDCSENAVGDRLRDALAETLGDAMDCTRVWEAWDVGTMGPEDFQIIAEDDERLEEIVDAALGVFAIPQPDKWVPEMTDELRWILGRPNFACAPLAQTLRNMGHEIKPKAEDEQAAVIHWMLSLHEKHGDQWKAEAESILESAKSEKAGAES